MQEPWRAAAWKVAHQRMQGFKVWLRVGLEDFEHGDGRCAGDGWYPHRHDAERMHQALRCFVDSMIHFHGSTPNIAADLWLHIQLQVKS